MHQQDRHRSRRDPGYPGGLAERRRSHRSKLLANFVRQPCERAIVQIVRQRRVLLAARALDLFGRALDIAAVARLDLQITHHLRRQAIVRLWLDRERAIELDQRLVVHFRPAQQFEGADFAPRGRASEYPLRPVIRDLAGLEAPRLQLCQLASDCGPLGFEQRPAVIADQSQFPAPRRQPRVGIVLAQQQAVLGPTGEHAVGFGRAAGNHGGAPRRASVALMPASRPWAAASS